MSKVVVFTDASRIELEDGTNRAAWGWIAVDFYNPFDSLASTHVVEMKTNQNSTVYAETKAVFEAVKNFSHMDEIHIFTDSLYAAFQVEKHRTRSADQRRAVRVMPEAIAEIASMDNVYLHHIRSHRSFFFNELVDKMVGAVSRGEMDEREAEQWGRETCRRGVLELTIGKKSKPKYVRRQTEKSEQTIARAYNKNN